MSVEIRPIPPERARDAFLIRAQAFHIPVDRFERWSSRVQHDRWIGAFDGERLVGTSVAHGMAQFFGGRAVPMGGVAGVAVTPDRRGTGIGYQLIAHQLDAMRERGEVISALYPATTIPYRRTGWELAGCRISRRVPLRSLAALPAPDDGTIARPGTLADLDRLIAVYQRVAPHRPGWLERDHWWWSRLELWLDGPHSYLYVAERDGAVTGYVQYSQKEASDPTEWIEYEIEELVAIDRGATLALWRLIGSSSSVGTWATFHGGPEEPLTLLLAEQDVQPREDWRWMLRLVDAAGAIAARGYPPGVTANVHLELIDERAPWNAGHHVLDVVDGKATLSPGGLGTVRLTINALSTMYTGMTSPASLAVIGALDGATASDLAALQAVFAGPAPWMVDFF